MKKIKAITVATMLFGLLNGLSADVIVNGRKGYIDGEPANSVKQRASHTHNDGWNQSLTNAANQFAVYPFFSGDIGTLISNSSSSVFNVHSRDSNINYHNIGSSTLQLSGDTYWCKVDCEVDRQTRDGHNLELGDKLDGTLLIDGNLVYEVPLQYSADPNQDCIVNYTNIDDISVTYVTNGGLDSDGDGLSDNLEKHYTLTSITNAYTDTDDYTDAQEFAMGTDGTKNDDYPNPKMNISMNLGNIEISFNTYEGCESKIERSPTAYRTNVAVVASDTPTIDGRLDYTETNSIKNAFYKGIVNILDKLNQ